MRKNHKLITVFFKILIKVLTKSEVIFIVPVIFFIIVTVFISMTVNMRRFLIFIMLPIFVTLFIFFVFFITSRFSISGRFLVLLVLAFLVRPCKYFKKIVFIRLIKTVLLYKDIICQII